MHVSLHTVQPILQVMSVKCLLNQPLVNLIKYNIVKAFFLLNHQEAYSLVLPNSQVGLVFFMQSVANPINIYGRNLQLKQNTVTRYMRA